MKDAGGAAELRDVARNRLRELGDFLRTASPREHEAAGLALLAIGLCLAAQVAEQRERRRQS